MFVYVEQMLAANGYADACASLPSRSPGESGRNWLSRVRKTAAAGVTVHLWDQAHADAMVYVTQILCVELARFPAMVEWNDEEYQIAWENNLHPSDQSGMEKALTAARDPLDIEQPSSGSSKLIGVMLDSLIAEAEATRA